MKNILICEDDRDVLNSVEALASETVRIHSVTTVSGLEGMSRNGILYDFIVLDGHVTDGSTTRYLELLKQGAFEHLKDAHFLLMSSETRVAEYQSTVLSEEVLGADPDSPLYTDEIATWLKSNPQTTEDDLYQAFPSLDRDEWLLYNDFKPKWQHTRVSDKRELPAVLKQLLQAE